MGEGGAVFKNPQVRGSAGPRVSQPRCFAAVFNALQAQKFGMRIVKVNFWSRDFWGLVEALGIFLGFLIFAP